MGIPLDGLGARRSAEAIFILPITSYSKATPSEIKLQARASGRLRMI
jgi:hypothetical protein